jgi:hypothetical protein
VVVVGPPASTVTRAPGGTETKVTDWWEPFVMVMQPGVIVARTAAAATREIAFIALNPFGVILS